MRDAYNLPCGHNFCLDCVDEALAERSMCPSCKNPAWSKDTVKSAQTVRKDAFDYKYPASDVLFVGRLIMCSMLCGDEVSSLFVGINVVASVVC